jgi:uncharacterized membrane protein YkoI
MQTRIKLRLLTLVAAVSVSASALADIQLTLEQLPEPVRKTALVEVKAGRIVEIEQEDDDGETVYEIEFVLDDIKYEIDVAPDGTLLRKHRD